MVVFGFGVRLYLKMLVILILFVNLMFLLIGNVVVVVMLMFEVISEVVLMNGVLMISMCGSVFGNSGFGVLMMLYE